MEQDQEKKLIENRMFQSRLPESAGFSMLFTPLIDVFFLLLVFVTLGSEVVYSQGIMIDPPAIDDSQYQHANKLVIALSATPTGDNVQIYFNDHTVNDYNKLENQLKDILGSAANRSLKGRVPVVMLRAHRTVPSYDIAQVMAICRKNNVRLFYMTKPK